MIKERNEKLENRLKSIIFQFLKATLNQWVFRLDLKDLIVSAFFKLI